MRYSNVAWTENLAFFSPENIPLSSNLEAIAIQDLSSDKSLQDFLVDKNYNTATVQPFVAPIISRPCTLFIKALSTPITFIITFILTLSITSLVSKTSSFTPPSPIHISNKPITCSQSRLNHILITISSLFLAQYTSYTPVLSSSLAQYTSSTPKSLLIIASPTILSLLALANSVEPYEPLIYTNAIRDTSTYKLQ